MRWLEPFWFEITEKNIQLGLFDSPLRILHLSDFHASEEVPFRMIERAVDVGLEQGVHVAFLTGDFITSRLPDETEYQRILKKLTSRVLTFACIGNHDGGNWAARTSHGYHDFIRIQTLLTRSGVHFLFNQQASVEAYGKRFIVAGLGDYWSNDCRPEQMLGLKRKGSESREPIFVLSHNPDSKEMCLAYDWDLMCCGHTHGGQLVVPVLDWRPFLPVRDHSCAEGLWTQGTQHVHVTRGVGNLHGMRFNCRPEISVLSVS